MICPNLFRRLSCAAAATLVVSFSASANDDTNDYDHKVEAQEFVHGAPTVASEAWMLAAGGRIYDNWWSALDRPEPEGTNPAYPVTVNSKQTGSVTWRCKECHGWDYRGKDGIYSSGSHFTGIPGIDGAIGMAEEKIITILRDSNHPYTPEMISDEEMLRLAAFVSRGQVDMRTFIDLSTRKVKAGDIRRGREVFQTVCAACHGFDGRLLDWGEGDAHNYVGTEAAELPDEVFNKIYNAHPGVQMVNLRALPLSDAVAVLAYAATLPTGPIE